MNRRSRLTALVTIGLLATACDQLGNPRQFATGPTSWSDQNGRVVTTTRSFNNEATIRRLVSEGMEGFDHSDPSIGPSQTLTLVVVVPEALRATRRPRIELTTTFKMGERRPIRRRWSVPARSTKWSAAFALPEPPVGAITAVAP